jgi:hypothetical protein
VWEVEYTDTFGSWWHELSEDEQERVAAAVGLLEQGGPALGRPLVDSIKGSGHPNMKELRPRGGHVRVLFAFDPRRMAILLIGGARATNGAVGTHRRFPRPTSYTTSTSKRFVTKEQSHEQDQAR